ncbi:MAG: hypothetical protein AAF802_20215 [Planctomycetota bacterium]
MRHSEIFQNAVAARDAGDFKQSERLLMSMVQAGHNSAACFAVLGRVQWELDKADSAVIAFRKATELAPNSEEASLGLFHSLWELKRSDDAFEEMKRFLKSNKSDEYSKLLRELNQA